MTPQTPATVVASFLNRSAGFRRAALHTGVTGIVIERPTDADVKATSTKSGCDSAHDGGKDGHDQGAHRLPPRIAIGEVAELAREGGIRETTRHVDSGGYVWTGVRRFLPTRHATAFIAAVLPPVHTGLDLQQSRKLPSGLRGWCKPICARHCRNAFGSRIFVEWNGGSETVRLCHEADGMACREMQTENSPSIEAESRRRQESSQK